MASAVVVPSLLAGNPFTAGEIQLCEAVASTDMLLVTAVYVLPPLRSQLAVFSSKISLCLVYTKPHREVREGNEPVYLSVQLCRIVAFLWLQARPERSCRYSSIMS